MKLETILSGCSWLQTLTGFHRKYASQTVYHPKVEECNLAKQLGYMQQTETAANKTLARTKILAGNLGQAACIPVVESLLNMVNFLPNTSFSLLSANK